MLSPLPRHSDGRYCVARSVPSYQPSPIGLSGRPVHRPFRGLLSVHSRYGLHTRAATVFCGTHIPEGFNGFVTSAVAPVASGGSTSPGGTFTHWNNTAFSRRTPKAVGRHCRNHPTGSSAQEAVMRSPLAQSHIQGSGRWHAWMATAQAECRVPSSVEDLVLPPGQESLQLLGQRK